MINKISKQYFKIWIVALSIYVFSHCEQKAKKEDLIVHPNILFISIDDLNDWAQPLGGNSQAITPHLTAFAQQGVNFTRNYCTSPVSNPSRTSLMTGMHTFTSGMYSNYQDWRKTPNLNGIETIGHYFRKHGYYSTGAGKIFHYDQVDTLCWDTYYPSQSNNMPQQFIPEGVPVNMPKFKYMYSHFDWSPIPLSDEETADYKSVQYVSEQLKKDHSKPFFLACGIYRPHVPWYVPQKYFDMFPLDSIKLPKTIENDLDDLGPRAKEMIERGGNYHKHVVEGGQWKKAIQGYLASIAYADAMLGKLLEELEKSPYAKNTIVVIWSDHGWHLGEKNHWRKFALWESTIRTVFMMKVPDGIKALPNGSERGRSFNQPTSLLDIYPTLIELCGLPEKDNLDGTSLVSILEDTNQDLIRPIITTYDFGDYSVRYKHWHYIKYIDDSEELYNLENDPEEWYNLSGKEEFLQIKQKLKDFIPKNPVPLPEESLIELMEHHVPPIKSKEFYYSDERKEWLKRFESEGN